MVNLATIQQFRAFQNEQLHQLENRFVTIYNKLHIEDGGLDLFQTLTAWDLLEFPKVAGHLSTHFLIAHHQY